MRFSLRFLERVSTLGFSMAYTFGSITSVVAENRIEKYFKLQELASQSMENK